MINKLREKPPHVRDRIAALSALVFAGVVAFFWIGTVAVDYSDPDTKTSFNESFSPFKVFGNNVKSALERSKAELSSVDPNSPDYDKETQDVTIGADGVVNLGVVEE